MDSNKKVGKNFSHQPKIESLFVDFFTDKVIVWGHAQLPPSPRGREVGQKPDTKEVCQKFKSFPSPEFVTIYRVTQGYQCFVLDLYGENQMQCVGGVDKYIVNRGVAKNTLISVTR